MADWSLIDFPLQLLYFSWDILEPPCQQDSYLAPGFMVNHQLHPLRGRKGDDGKFGHFPGGGLWALVYLGLHRDNKIHKLELQHIIAWFKTTYLTNSLCTRPLQDSHIWFLQILWVLKVLQVLHALRVLQALQFLWVFKVLLVESFVGSLSPVNSVSSVRSVRSVRLVNTVSSVSLWFLWKSQNLTNHNIKKKS